MAKRPLRLAVFAGEPSGDWLGAELLQACAARRPDTQFIGAGGPCMERAGLRSRVAFDRLAMNGLVEPFVRLPELHAMRQRLTAALAREQPDAFVGIDFNVFNLSMARRLRRRGIATVQYVSPSVYAWRARRVRTIARAVDRLLALFPFEPGLYAGSGVDARFVGHPLADRLAQAPASGEARRRLGIGGGTGPLLAVMPGSRDGEMSRHAELFLQAATRFARHRPGTRVVIPIPAEARRARIDAAAARVASSLPVYVRPGRGWDAIAAADGVLTKSGTAALEALLIGRPMVVSYRVDPASAFALRRLLETPYVALPNLLAGRREVPELLQDAATPETLAGSLLGELERHRDARIGARRAALADALSGDAAGRAATAVLELAERTRSSGATSACDSARESVWRQGVA